MIQKELTKPMLIQRLKSVKSDPFGSKVVLQDRCKKLGISLHQQTEVIQEGWQGKPKGALQVLFQRGWIDPNLIQHYTGNGMKENRR